MTNILIRGGLLVDPANGVHEKKDLYLADGKVIGVGNAPSGFKSEETIDASNFVVAPGLVDISAHLREPGMPHKGTIASETKAALKGGITTLCCPPSTKPVIDTPSVVEWVMERAKEAGYPNIKILGALTEGLKGEALSEMAALKKSGCVGLSNVWHPIVNTSLLAQALKYAATFELPVFVYPEEPFLVGQGGVHEGSVSTRLGLPGTPSVSETIAVSRMIELCELTGVRIHFCRLSTAKGVQQVAAAKADGLPVTADVAVHQLHLTELDMNDFDSLCHVRPPLRTMRDRQGLRAGVAEGVVDVICSDHQPHDIPAKFAPIASTEPGISSLETLLPLALHLYHAKEVSLATVLARVTSKPAEILGVRAGHLAEGMPADVCIFDPEKTWSIEDEGLISQGQHTPFESWEFTGQVQMTLVAGEVKYRREGL